jgi:hypothetical protein
MKRSCPEENFFYLIKELKAFRTLAISLFSQKKRRWKFLEISKIIF